MSAGQRLYRRSTAARGRAPRPCAAHGRCRGRHPGGGAVADLVVQARPQDLITGVHGMVDIIRRAMPPDFSKLPDVALADAGDGRHRDLRHPRRRVAGAAAGGAGGDQRDAVARRSTAPRAAIIGFARAVPDLVWALLFVTAVGLGPFPGALALSVHSIGMLGRLFAEMIEDMDMAPVEALTLTGANRLQVFTHGVVPSVLPSLLGIALYRLDENIRSSLVLGFVGAGGIGFELLTAMNLFQYRRVAAAGGDVRHRHRRRAAFGGVSRAAELTPAGL